MTMIALFEAKLSSLVKDVNQGIIIKSLDYIIEHMFSIFEALFN